MDLSKLSTEALAAAMRGGVDGWGQVGAATRHVRYAEPARSRRRCPCGCGLRVTHIGMCNGLAMLSGCELMVRRWVREK